MDNYVTAEISAAAVRENLATLRRHVGGSVKLCAVVKADCYGHGLDLLYPVLAKSADAFAVSTPAEAVRLRTLGATQPILMFFSPCAFGNNGDCRAILDELIGRDVTMTVVCPEELALLTEAVKRRRRPASVHVKIDTGMTRSGVLCERAPGLVQALRAAEGVRLTGLYTHFATADEVDKAFTHQQLARFLATVDACGGRQGLCLHAANSAATIDLPETHLDMVRPGIAMYGYAPSDDLAARLPLQPALSIRGPLMQVKDIPPGARCGYGLTHEFDGAARLGLVPIGYGDGYPRALSNRATVRVGGVDCPVRGRVSMDQLIVDLSKAPGVKVGDRVEIVSPDPQSPHSVEGLARLSGTIPYEITCRLTGSRIRRVAVEGA